MYKSENLKKKNCVQKQLKKTTSTVYKSLSQNEIVKNLHRERKNVIITEKKEI